MHQSGKGNATDRQPRSHATAHWSPCYAAIFPLVNILTAEARDYAETEPAAVPLASCRCLPGKAAFRRTKSAGKAGMLPMSENVGFSTRSIHLAAAADHTRAPRTKLPCRESKCHQLVPKEILETRLNSSRGSEKPGDLGRPGGHFSTKKFNSRLVAPTDFQGKSPAWRIY
jgi:hypothetical protein